jgi:predicted phage tail protein
LSLGALPLYVSHRPHPFDLRAVRVELPYGLTIAEILEVACADPALRRTMSVRIAGHDIPAAVWHRVRPKPGVLIEAVPLPLGGDTLRTILIIAVVAAAMAAGAWIAGPALLGATGATFTFASAGIGGALTLGGMLALNALIPPAKPQIDQPTTTSPTYGIEGAQNSARINAPVPVVMGVHKVVPSLAAPWTTLLDDDDEYLYGLLCWSVGPASVSSIKIGDTPVENFQGVQLEHYLGDTTTSPTFTLYPSQVTITAVSALLLSGRRQVRQTDTDTDYAILEFQFREGAIKLSDSTGDELGVTITLRYRYRLVGAGTWSAETETNVAGKQASPKRTARRIAFPSRGQYEIEVWRVTGDTSSSSINDKLWWENIKSVNYDPPVRKCQGLVLTAIKIKASNQLSGVIRDLNGIVTSYRPAWNGSAWIYVPTSQPAALFRGLLQGNSLKRPVPDDEIDLAQLQYWATVTEPAQQYCNFVIDRDLSVWEALSIIAATGRATPTRINGKWSVVIDEPKGVPAQMFTARNCRNFMARRIFADEPHALRVQFVDAGAGYTTQTRDVYYDGYDASTATEFEEAEFPGVTNADQLWRMARWRMAEGRLRAEAYTFETDFEHLIATRGDLIMVQHSAPLWGRSAGRIRRVLLNAGGLMEALELDEAVVFDGAGDFVIRIRLSNNAQIVLDITEPVGETRIVFVEPPVANSFVIAPGDLYVIGLQDEEAVKLLIRGIEPIGDLAARITCVPYHPAVYTAHLGTVPDWDPNITAVPGQEAPIIRGVTSGDAAGVRNADGSLTMRALVLLWDDGTRPLATLSGVDVAWKRLDDEGPFNIIQAPPEATTVAIVGVPVDTTLRINARYRFSTGRLGRWGSEVQPYIAPPTIPPADVKGLIIDGLYLRWIHASGGDHKGFLIKWSPVGGQPWEECEDVTDQAVTATEFPTAAIPDGARQILIKAVTIHGVQSVSPARATAEAGFAFSRIDVGNDSLRTRGFPGTVVNAVKIGGELRGLDNSLFLDGGGRWLVPEGADWLEPSWAEVTYICNVYTPTTLLRTDRIYLDYDIQGDFKLAYRWGTADLAFAAFVDPVPDGLLTGNFNDPVGSSVDEEVLLVWRAWRQGIPALPNQPLQLRCIIAGGGTVQPLIRELRLRFDAEEIQETFSNLPIGPASTFVPKQRTYRKVAYVLGSITAPSTATTFVVDGKAPNAIRVRLTNAAGADVAGFADVRIGGG